MRDERWEQAGGGRYKVAGGDIFLKRGFDEERRGAGLYDRDCR